MSAAVHIEREVYQAVDAGHIVDYEVTPTYDGENLVPYQVHIKATGSGGLNIDVTLTNAR